MKKDNSHSTYASRTMYWSGPIIAGLRHLPRAALHRRRRQSPATFEGDVYDNVIAGFQTCLDLRLLHLRHGLLCMHLYHGIWSMFQSLGINHPRYTPHAQESRRGLRLARRHRQHFHPHRGAGRS